MPNRPFPWDIYIKFRKQTFVCVGGPICKLPLSLLPILTQIKGEITVLVN